MGEVVTTSREDVPNEVFDATRKVATSSKKITFDDVLTEEQLKIREFYQRLHSSFSSFIKYALLQPKSSKDWQGILNTLNPLNILKFKDSTGGNYLKGMAQYQLGNYDAALNNFLLANPKAMPSSDKREITPKHIGGLQLSIAPTFMIAATYEKKGDLESALKYLKEATKSQNAMDTFDSTMTNLLLNLTMLLSDKAGSPEQGVELYKQITNPLTRNSNRHASLRANYAYVLFSAGKESEAIPVLEDLLLKPDNKAYKNPEEFLQMALSKSYSNVGMFSSSINYILREKLHESNNPEVQEIALNSLVNNYLNIDKPEKARLIIEKMIFGQDSSLLDKLNHQEITYAQAVNNLENKNEINTVAHRYQLMLSLLWSENFQEAIDVAPLPAQVQKSGGESSDIVYLSKAVAYLALGEASNSLYNAQKVKETNSNQYLIAALLANKEFDKAEKQILLENDEGTVDRLVNLGQLDYFKGNYDDAIKLLEKANAEEPDKLVPLSFLAAAYYAKGQAETDIFENSLNLDYASHFALLTLEQFKERNNQSHSSYVPAMRAEVVLKQIYQHGEISDMILTNQLVNSGHYTDSQIGKIFANEPISKQN